MPWRSGGTRMKRRTLLGAGMAGLAAPAVRAQPAKVLRFIPQSDVTVLDPVWTTVTVTRNHAYLIYDTLYGQDESFVARPQMVAGHVVEADGLLWRLTLRDGLRFHDGTPVLARDCVASVRRWAVRDAFGSALMAATAEVSAPDDRSIVFRLIRPFPLLPDALAKTAGNICPIMPERLAMTDPFKQVTDMTGSGPFRFVDDERIVGARTVYAKNPAYVPAPGPLSFTAGGKVPLLDRVEWTVINDPGTASAALLNNEADWWEVPTVDLIPQLRRGGIVVSVNDPASNLGLLRFNHLHPPFDNPAVRRAVLSVVDQTDCMIAAASEDRSFWRDRTGVFSSSSAMANDAGIEAVTSPRDYAAARRALAAAGYKGEPVVALVPSDQAATAAMALVAIDQMQRAGLTIDTQMTDWGTVTQRRTSRAVPGKGGWQVFFSFLEGTNNFNPAGHLGIRANGDKAWFGWPISPALEALRTQWFEATDLAGQQAACRALQMQFWQDVPYVPTGEYFRPIARHPRVSLPSKGFPMFYNVRLG